MNSFSPQHLNFKLPVRLLRSLEVSSRLMLADDGREILRAITPIEGKSKGVKQLFCRLLFLRHL